eukprot:m.240354 g.240354  ORF g.240354 m.240354 type:complete len:234 (-) comp10926_c0_seq2:198-899(-)
MPASRRKCARHAGNALGGHSVAAENEDGRATPPSQPAPAPHEVSTWQECSKDTQRHTRKVISAALDAFDSEFQEDPYSETCIYEFTCQKLNARTQSVDKVAQSAHQQFYGSEHGAAVELPRPALDVMRARVSSLFKTRREQILIKASADRQVDHRIRAACNAEIRRQLAARCSAEGCEPCSARGRELRKDIHVTLSTLGVSREYFSTVNAESRRKRSRFEQQPQHTLSSSKGE